MDIRVSIHVRIISFGYRFLGFEIKPRFDIIKIYVWVSNWVLQGLDSVLMYMNFKKYQITNVSGTGSYIYTKNNHITRFGSDLLNTISHMPIHLIYITL